MITRIPLRSLLTVRSYSLRGVGTFGRIDRSAIAFRKATKPGKYQDRNGLFPLVRASGTRSWPLRVQVDGKRREFGIGPAADIGLAEGRERAAKIRSFATALIRSQRGVRNYGQQERSPPSRRLP